MVVLHIKMDFHDSMFLLYCKDEYYLNVNSTGKQQQSLNQNKSDNSCQENKFYT